MVMVKYLCQEWAWGNQHGVATEIEEAHCRSWKGNNEFNRAGQSTKNFGRYSVAGIFSHQLSVASNR